MKDGRDLDEVWPDAIHDTVAPTHDLAEGLVFRGRVMHCVATFAAACDSE
jgi:hypothetical protein